MTQLHYFAGRGRAETTRWMLAANGIAFTNVAIDTPGALAVLRASGRLPFDQLPLLEIDGLRISQTTALVRYLARRGDLYGDDATDALWCDMIAGVAADLVEPAITAAFMPTPAIALQGLRQRVDKFCPRLEQRLAANGGKFIAARRLTFADIVLGEALSAHVELAPDMLDDYPLLAGLQQAIVRLPGIAAYLNSPQRWPIADEAYVINVAEVLQRALPAHMPDPERFVRTAG
ncbi:MAG: glutathione S-transferase family protein [Burkholderiaceae bacterium]